MVQCCLPKDWPGDPLGPKQVLLEGSKDPACWFSEWCDVAQPPKYPKSIEIPRIWGRLIPPTAVFSTVSCQAFLLGALPLGGWVYPIPRIGFSRKKKKGILRIICQKTMNHELSPVSTIFNLEWFPSSMIVLESKTDVLFGYQLPNQNPTRHPGHWASIRGWDLQGLWIENTCIDDTK